MDAVFSENGNPIDTITQKWNIRKDQEKKNKKIDTRFYFNGLIKDIEYVDNSGKTVDGKFTIRNYLAGGFSDLHIKKSNDGIFDVYITNKTEADNDDKDKDLEELELSENYQQIYYGAPGTGKSHSVKLETKALEKQGRVVRTTFHPDSDYSTFVGCYKPTMRKTGVKNAVGKDEETIVYEFVPQSFLQAYVDAWKSLDEPEFLVIEEINRGNCAQIFGDLFQLLDRDGNGYSEYAIRADKDLQKYLGEAFDGVEIDGYPKIKRGEELLLPKNFYIRATMNTSDQSLFPIDSAFKRRWDWKYIPIAKGEDRDTKKELEWKIDADGERYDWWEFIQKINKIVIDTTSSEDKQLGFFFCKSDREGIIRAETFVSKVIFYLWNDVFKDYGFDDEIFKDRDDNGKLSFDKFYDGKGDVVVGKVRMFLRNLKLESEKAVGNAGEVDNGGTEVKAGAEA
ncbi:MAG: AAA family ATPase [Prevotella sp.]|nr:AAA family ATPase [Prevotella sp.]